MSSRLENVLHERHVGGESRWNIECGYAMQCEESTTTLTNGSVVSGCDIACTEDLLSQFGRCNRSKCVIWPICVSSLLRETFIGKYRTAQGFAEVALRGR